MRDSYFPPSEINTIISTVQRLKLEFNRLAVNADKRIVEKAYQEFCTLPF